MRRITLGIVMLLAALTAQAQTFYEMTFVTPNDKDNQYVGLFIYTDDEHCKMRLVDNEALENNGCYEANYTCHVEDKEGDDDIGVMYYVPDNDDLPILIWVWKEDDLSDMNEAPYLAYDMNDPDSWIETRSFVEITLNDMDEEYIAQFYGSDEPEYKMMLNGIRTVKNQHIGTVTGPSSNTNYGTSNTSSSSTLHLVVVANTEVSDIGPACEIDLRRIRSEFGGIAKALGMKLNENLVTGQNYSKGRVESALDNLNPGSNDVVVFVYTGHGFRFKDQQDYYPCLDLSSSAYEDAEENFMALSDIFSTIVSKHARLNIVLSDCCNSIVNMNQPVVRSNSLFSRSNTNFNLQKLSSLFLKTKGDIIATAASPGEYSWCGDNGGFFLLSFFESLRSQISALNQGTPSWNTLINNTISSAARKTDNNASTKRQNGLKDVAVKSL